LPYAEWGAWFRAWRAVLFGFFAEKRFFGRGFGLGEPLSLGFSLKKGSLTVVSGLESRYLWVFR